MQAPARFPQKPVRIDSGSVAVFPRQLQRVTAYRLTSYDATGTSRESLRTVTARCAGTLGAQVFRGQHRLVAIRPLEQEGAVLENLNPGGHWRHLGNLSSQVSRTPSFDARERL